MIAVGRGNIDSNVYFKSWTNGQAWTNWQGFATDIHPNSGVDVEIMPNSSQLILTYFNTDHRVVVRTYFFNTSTRTVTPGFTYTSTATITHPIRKTRYNPDIDLKNGQLWLYSLDFGGNLTQSSISLLNNYTTASNQRALPHYYQSSQFEVYNSFDITDSQDQIVYQGWQASPVFQFACSDSEKTKCLENGKNYSIRVKASDRSQSLDADALNNANISKWSQWSDFKVDTSIPKVYNLNLSEQRISPTNPTSINIKDTTRIDFSFSEANLDRVELQIYKLNPDGSKGGLVDTQDRCNISGQLMLCNSQNLGYIYNPTLAQDHLSNRLAVSFDWDGKYLYNPNANITGGFFFAIMPSRQGLGDGQYLVQAVVYSLSSKTNDQSLGSSSKIIIIDDTPPSTSIATPSFNQWVNTNTITLSGSAGFDLLPNKEDKDIVKLEVAVNNPASKIDITNTISASHNAFSYNLELLDGPNTIYLTATDSVGNVSNRIWNGQNWIDTWTVNVDNTPPSISNLLPAGLLTTGPINANPTLSFKISDNSKTYNSGVFTGINPTQYTILLQRIQNGQSEIFEVYKNGVNLNNPTRRLICSGTGLEVQCNLSLTGLQDGQYQVYIQTTDRAGNLTCLASSADFTPNCPNHQIIDHSFIVDTQNNLQVLSPAPNSTVASQSINIKLKAEENSWVQIQSPELSRSINFYLDKDKTTSQPIETDILSLQTVLSDFNNPNVSFVSEYKNNERLFSIPDSLVSYSCDNGNCEATVNVNLKSDPINPVIQNLRVSSQDKAGNSFTINHQFTVDLAGVNLSSIPNRLNFSPNGDGFFDDITFTNEATDFDGNSFTQISNITVNISNLQNQLVFSQDFGTDLPPTWIWDGQGNQLGLTNLPAGSYSYQLILTTNKSRQVKVNHILQIIDASDNTLFLLSPDTNTSTTRRVIKVSGQAPNSSETNPWTVDICIQSDGDNICDYTKTDIAVTASGGFESLVLLPEYSNSHIISATAKDTAGNIINSQNTISITVDATNPLLEVKAVSSFYGINSQRDIDLFLSTQKPLEQLRTISLESTVTNNTQLVELGFSQYTNVVSLPLNVDPKYSSIYNPDKQIATINTIIEDSLLLNPYQNNSIKKDLLKSPDLIPQNNQCTDATCQWNYTYIPPFWLSDGIYEFGFTGTKDTLRQTMTVGVELGHLPSSPRLLRVEKSVGEETQIAKQIQSTFYTNTTTNQLIGAADPNTPITITITDPNTQATSTFTTNTTDSGIWTLETILPTNGNGNYPLTITSTKANYSSTSLEQYYLNLDTTLPQIQSVQTHTPDNTINPWLRTGDGVRFTLQTDKPLASASIYQELGFREDMGRVITCTPTTDNDPNCPTPDQSRKELFLNSTQASTTCQLFSSCHPLELSTTTFDGYLTIIRPLEGMYYPVIKLTDLAGNTVFYTNNHNQDTIIIDPSDRDNNDPVVFIPLPNEIQTDEEVQDFITRTNGNPRFSVLDKRQEIKDNYVGVEATTASPEANVGAIPQSPVLTTDSILYSKTNRSPSLDFSLRLDNHKPVKGFFSLSCSSNQKPTLDSQTISCFWGDRLDSTFADGLVPETDRIMTAKDYFDTDHDNRPTDKQATPQFVIKNNQITLSGYGEKNQRIKFFIQRYTDPNDPTSTQTEYIQEIQVSSENCFSIYDYDKIERGNLITRFKDICEFKYTYTFPDEGLSPNGQILSSYSFSFYPLDLAGNVPVKTPNSGTALRPNINYGEKGLFCSVGAIPQSPDATCLLTNSLFKPTTINSNLYYNETNIVGGDNYTTIGSIYSETLTLYHDTQPPETNNLNDIRSQSYNGTIVDFVGESPLPLGEGQGEGKTPITQDTTIDITATSERLSDRIFTLTTPKGTKQDLTGTKIKTEWDQANSLKVRSGTLAVPNTLENSTLLARSTYEGQTILENLPLGKNERDDSKLETCTTISNSPIVGRRIGTCEDGNYTLGYKAGDTAGNMTGEKTQVVERDTVRPDAPIVKATKYGDIIEEYLGVEISGEGYTTALIEVRSVFGVEKREYRLDENGQFRSNNLIGKLECEFVEYTVAVKLKDRAENISFESTDKIITQECPRCSYRGNGSLIRPYKNDNAYIAFPYGFSPQYFGGKKFHTGVDYNGVPEGEPVYPARSGTVTFARYRFTNADKPNIYDENAPDTSNYVIIDHGIVDGVRLTTLYVHLMYETYPPVKVGDVVTVDTKLGRNGNTGRSSRAHLHFEVRANGKHVDPTKYLDQEKTNLSDEQKARYCEKNEGAGSKIDETEWLWDGKQTKTPIITFKKGWFGWHFESIEDFEPELIKIVKETDYHIGNDINLEGFAKQYNVYGVAPYKGMDVKIRFKEGDKIIEERTEALDSAKFIGRASAAKLNWSTTNEMENEGSFGRLKYTVNNRWSIGTPNEVTFDDNMWIDSKLSHTTKCPDGGDCKMPDGHTRWRNEKASNLVNIKNNIQRLKYEDRGILTPFKVYGNSSDTSGQVVPYNRNERYVKFIDASGKAGQVYDGNSKVWILSHGWNGGLGDLNEIQKKINSHPNHKNDIVLILEWREASWNDWSSCALINTCPIGANRATTWVRPVAVQASNELREWGLKDARNLRLVGHSLGSLIIHEISREMGGNSEIAIALDPPRSGRKIQNSPSVNIQDFNQLSTFSRSYVGRHSKCGSHEISKSSSESIYVNFKRADKDVNEDGACKEHAWVKDVYMEMLTGVSTSNQQYSGVVLENGVLSLDDKSKHNYFLTRRDNCLFFCEYYGGHHAQLDVEIEKDPRQLRYWVDDQGNRQERLYKRK
jgi:hypothetical protein